MFYLGQLKMYYSGSTELCYKKKQREEDIKLGAGCEKGWEKLKDKVDVWYDQQLRNM